MFRKVALFLLSIGLLVVGVGLPIYAGTSLHQSSRPTLTTITKPSQPSDTQAIQAQLQPLINYLDSSSYANQVTWAEHILLSYQLTQGRMPTPSEFVRLDLFRRNTTMSRSDALSIILRGETLETSWEQCRRLISQVTPAHFQPSHELRQLANSYSQIPPTQQAELLQELATPATTKPTAAPLAITPATPNGSYNTYFGFLHAQSELSDGEGNIFDAYTYAHEVGGLDFFSMTDHGELLLIWPWEGKWSELKEAAEATYQPGEYVTLWGFEWSNPIMGHINVLNTDDYTNAIFDFGVQSLYDWLVEHPTGFAQFNHPGRYDYLFIEFLHLRLYEAAVPQLVGIENWNKDDGFDEYYYGGSWFNDTSYYDLGNLKGWYLGSLGSQDNHSFDFGTRNDFRTGVLAESLTREAIIDAYLHRRIYATEDKDLELDFRYQGYPMGSQLSGIGLLGTPRLFDVNGCDGSGDTFQEARLYRGGVLLDTQTVSGNCFNVVLTDLSPVPAGYYYVIVRQTDDNDGNGRPDEAISSPIWIE